MLVRLFKRLSIFLTGLVIIYLAVWKFLPFFDHRIPLAFALFVTYIFTAYVFIPASIRILRLFFRPAHIPLYCVTPDGFASDPINVGIIGTKVEIIKAMRAAGWHMADKKTLKTSLRLGYSIIFNKPYDNAPFSSLYLFGRRQDLGFQLPIEDSRGQRHHIRFWACQLKGPEDFESHVNFWKRFHKLSKLTDQRQFWVGAASKDIGIMPIRHNAQLTHMIDPNTDTERDLVADSLEAVGLVKSRQKLKVSNPFKLRNRVIGGFLQTDGQMIVCVLK